MAAAECGDALDSAIVAGHMHDRTEAVNRVSSAGEIPLSALGRSHARRLGKMRLWPRGLKVRQLDLRDGE